MNSKIQQNGRDKLLDIAKGIGIILVILGHSIQFGSGSKYISENLYFNNIYFIIIYSFHMTLFCTISGYLFSRSVQHHSDWNIIYNKFKRLVIPIFFWSLLYTPWLLFIDVTRHGLQLSIISVIKKFVYILFSSQWFLWAIFFFSIIVIVVRRFLNDSFWAYLILYVVLLFVEIKGKDYNFNAYVSNFPAFIIAYEYGKYCKKEDGESALECNRIMIVISAIVYVILLVCKLMGYDRDFSVAGCRIFYFCLGISGTVTFLWILYKLYYIKIDSRLWVLLERLGTDTLGLYIVAGYLDIELLQRITKAFLPSFILNLMESFVIIITSIYFIKLIRKNSILKMLLLGEFKD